MGVVGSVSGGFGGGVTPTRSFGSGRRIMTRSSALGVLVLGMLWVEEAGRSDGSGILEQVVLLSDSSDGEARAVATERPRRAGTRIGCDE